MDPTVNGVFLGVDLGTSGVRCSAIDNAGNELATSSEVLSQNQQPDDWKRAAFKVINSVREKVDADAIAAIAIDGTSSTVMLCDTDGTPCSPPIMYNDQSCTQEAEEIKPHAPENSAAHGASSSLAKALYLLKRHPDAKHICHQSDWIAALLCGRFDFSDENNCLKLGYDPLNREWPQWLSALNIKRSLLPRVFIPGTVVAPLQSSVTNELGLPGHCKLVAGTTDSIAAFIATGASEIGEAVTSLGSTLVIKLISGKPVFSSELGVYSHRLGDKWLAGGASNSGGNVLMHYFSREQLAEMTPRLDSTTSTGLDYYPLVNPGERFPVNNPVLKPRLEPRPDDDLMFFQGMLEGMAHIEHTGYKALEKLGAPEVSKIYSAGGGSSNPAWRTIRENIMGVPVVNAEHSDASYGAALLAMRSIVMNNEK